MFRSIEKVIIYKEIKRASRVLAAPVGLSALRSRSSSSRPSLRDARCGGLAVLQALTRVF